MSEIYLVTGNPNKLKELQAIFPKDVTLTAHELDLPEIQSLDPIEIVRDKLAKAYEEFKQPVIAEDVSVSLNCLNGLPGPFIKYFEQRLGNTALWILAEPFQDRQATITCTMGFFDGQKEQIVQGEAKGQVVSPRGENGWGFDFVFMPDGENRTNSQISPEEKNRISHRARAVNKLVDILFPKPQVE